MTTMTASVPISKRELPAHFAAMLTADMIAKIIDSDDFKSAKRIGHTHITGPWYDRTPDGYDAKVSLTFDEAAA